MRSMIVSLSVCFLAFCPLVGTGRKLFWLVQYWRCRGRWQAAPRFGRSGHGNGGQEQPKRLQERGAEADFGPEAPASPVVFFGTGLAAGLALALGFAGFASALSAEGAGLADSGLALACLAADLPAADFPSLPPSFSLASDFASTEASGFFTATRDFLPRRIVCSAASAATAAIKAAPVRVGPV
jgi:hypothetical protein